MLEEKCSKCVYYTRITNTYLYDKYSEKVDFGHCAEPEEPCHVSPDFHCDVFVLKDVGYG